MHALLDVEFCRQLQFWLHRCSYDVVSVFFGNLAMLLFYIFKQFITENKFKNKVIIFINFSDVTSPLERENVSNSSLIK